MKEVTWKSIARYKENGYKVFTFWGKLALVRKYSIYCASSFWKKYLSPYVLVKIVDEIDYTEYLKYFQKPLDK